MNVLFTPGFARQLERMMKEGRIPPQEIVLLNDDILGDVRQARVQEAIGGKVDPAFAHALQEKIARLEWLYRDWMETVQSQVSATV